MNNQGLLALAQLILPAGILSNFEVAQVVEESSLVHRSTNAFAELFNAKIKALRGVADINFSPFQGSQSYTPNPPDLSGEPKNIIRKKGGFCFFCCKISEFR